MKLKKSILILILLIAMFTSCSKKNKVQNEILRPVRYQTVTTSTGNTVKILSGKSKAGIETNLSFKVGGTIKSIKVKTGQKVVADQLIASLSASDYKLMYQEADLARENAKIQKQTAKSNYDRITALYEDNNISQKDYEAAKSAYNNASALHKASMKKRDLAKKQLDYTKLKAPMNGVISKVHFEINENVHPGETVVEINSGTRDPEVTVGMPESFISQVINGEKVSVRFTSIPDKEFVGIITEVSFSMSAYTKTYPVIIKLVNPSKDIRPGMSCDVTFTFKSEAEEERIIVPTVAVTEDQTGKYVYIVKDTSGGAGIVSRRDVTIGNLTGEGIEIYEGIEDGDMVVTAGVSKLTEGLKVKLLK